MLKVEPRTIDWLLEGDPAIRWQVQRDLLDEKPGIYEKERAKIATEGWGAKLLAKQEKDGSWSRSIYSPKFVSTHYVLLALKRFGLPLDNPQAIKACKVLLDSDLLTNVGKGFSADDEVRHPDLCIAGMMLSMSAYFQIKDERVHEIASFLIKRQMADEGWNCRDWRGDKHSSFNTTCSVLEGLWEYEQNFPKSKLPLAQAQQSGREFLLQHKLYKSHTTGKIVDEDMLKFPYLPQWKYDVLKGLEVFAPAHAPHDKRLTDGIDFLKSKQDKDGRWPQYRMQAGKYFVQYETPGKAGRANTMRVLRVLKWWDAKYKNSAIWRCFYLLRSLMMMGVGMHVPMRHFFRGWCAQADNLHIEMQFLAGQRVIEIHGGCIGADREHATVHLVAIFVFDV
jgi:hypothetical protein